MKAEDDPLPAESARAVPRALGIGLVAIAVALGAALLGGSLWPRVERVEQKVVAPAVEAVRAPAAAPAGAADMIAAACPALVAIGGGATLDDDGDEDEPAGNQTAPAAAGDAPGFLISADGYVAASAAHIGDAASPAVTLRDGRTLRARRIGADPLAGLVLLRIDATDLPFLQFADAALPRIGDQAVALATPGGRSCVAEPAMIGADFTTAPSATRAWVRVRPAFDADFAGAPVLGADGRVIGIAGLGAPPASGHGDPALLLPAGTASRVTGALLRGGGAAADDYGFVAQDVTPALAQRIGTDRQQGAMIALIAAGSAAARAGLRAGDVIFTVAGTPVANATELARALDGAGDTVTLDVMRRADRLSITMRGR